MKRTLYTLITGEVHQSVLASSFTQAVTWAEKNLPALKGAELLTITANAGVVDLTEGDQAAHVEVNPTLPPPPVRVKAPKPAKAAKPKPEPATGEEDVMTAAEVMEMLDCTASKVYGLKFAGKLTSAGFGKYTRSSVLAYQKWSDAPPKRKRKAKPAVRAPKPEAVKVSKPTPAPPADPEPDPEPIDPNAPWEPRVRKSDQYLHEDKAAAKVKMNLSQMLEVKKSGRIPGGNGWVNVTLLQAYINHKDYEPPFASN